MSDNMNVTDSSPSLTEGMDALAELNDLFSEDDEKIKESEANVLSQNLTGLCELLSRLGPASAGSVGANVFAAIVTLVRER